VTITNLRKAVVRFSDMIRNNSIPMRSGSASPGATDTSIAALKSLDPETKARREQQILDFIEAIGGATCHEFEVKLRLLHQSASAAITHLRKAGRLVDTGERRPTNTGRAAIVWGAAP
jgi:hypothetical protein